MAAAAITHCGMDDLGSDFQYFGRFLAMAKSWKIIGFDAEFTKDNKIALVEVAFPTGWCLLLRWQGVYLQDQMCELKGF